MGNIFSVQTLEAMFRMATPLILAALGGCFSERSGVTNIALEGIMLFGALAAVIGSHLTGSAWIGLLVAALIGGLFAYIHAMLSVDMKADQVISGTALNMLAAGGTIYISRVLFGGVGASKIVKRLPSWGVYPPTVYMAFFMVLVSWIILYKTPFGLRLRTVGEHPAAADTVGVDVYKMRYMAVVISGVLAGLAGAHMSIGVSELFSKNMIAGRGFIGLAAMIAGGWHPIGACVAALLFGFFESMSVTLGTVSNIAIPNQFISVLPYIITILVLAVAGTKSIGPKANGIPYEKGER